jgi:hypothetical protein
MEVKPQDILFFGILALLFLKRDPKLFTFAGLACIALSIPLFYKWIFFTAERLLIYGFIFILISTLLNLIYLRHNR